MPFHRAGAVLHSPEVTQRHVDASHSLLLVASDGLWKSFSSDEAGRMATEQLHALDYRRAPTADVVATCVSRLIDEAASRDKRAGRKSDDITCAILTFRG